jgi:hypothetical protein
MLASWWIVTLHDMDVQHWAVPRALVLVPCEAHSIVAAEQTESESPPSLLRTSLKSQTA